MDTEKGHLFMGQKSGEAKEALVYDSADFTTHGVIVGMTGSGKTGLGITILEEALLNGIPCLIIDPLGGAARRRSASSQAKARAENARTALEDEKAELMDLEADLQDEVADLEDEFVAKADSIEEVEIPLEKTEVKVAEVKLVWVPIG